MNRTPDSPRPRAVRISSAPEDLAGLSPLLDDARSAVGDVPALLELAKAAEEAAPKPGEGRTAFLWEILASVTAVDVAAGRAIEPHLDASAILAQAAGHAAVEGWDCPDFDGVHFDGAWGVFAAEAAGLRLEAKPADGCFLLQGSKPWCSLAAQLDHAVVTAHLDDGGRAAFAVDLHAPGVSFEDPEWTSRGLREIPSGTVHFDAVPAVPLGDAGWYYRRPGFAWGGMGVAACWLGGAVAVARGFKESLLKAADGGREPDQLALAHLGEIDRTLTALTGVPRPDRRADRRRGTHGRRRLERGPARPRQRRHRRRTHPDAGQPEPRPRPACLRPGLRKAHGRPRAVHPPAPRACATTPSSVPSRSRGTTHGELHAPGRRNRRGRLGSQRPGRAPGAAAGRRGARRPGVHRPGRAPGRRIPRRRRADGPAPAARRPRHGAAVHGGGGLPPGLTHHDAGTARRRPAQGIRRRARAPAAGSGLAVPRPARRQARRITGRRCTPRCSTPSPTCCRLGTARGAASPSWPRTGTTATRTTRRWAAAAAEAAGAGGHGLLEYPIWYWLWADAADQAWQSWLRLPLDPAERQAKAAAMASHTSQVRAPVRPARATRCCSRRRSWSTLSGRSRRSRGSVRPPPAAAPTPPPTRKASSTPSTPAPTTRGSTPPAGTNTANAPSPSRPCPA